MVKCFLSDCLRSTIRLLVLTISLTVSHMSTLLQSVSRKVNIDVCGIVLDLLVSSRVLLKILVHIHK